MTYEYIKPNEEQLAVMQSFREKFEKLHDEIQALPDSREKSLSLTKLQESNFWLNKSITKIN